MKSIPPIAFKGHEPAYRQIEQVLRTAITSGEWASGSRLPTVQAMASNYQTSVFTIQTALETLEKDGLIERVRRRGTFVTGGRTKLRQVGIFYGTDFLRGRAMGFYQEINHCLAKALEARDVKYRLWIDGRSDEDHVQPLDDLVEAVNRREIQGIIAPVVDFPESVWLQQLGLPLGLLSSASVPYQVNFDYVKGMALAMEEFRRQGCQTVGAILPVSAATHSSYETETSQSNRQILDGFTGCLADAGLKTRNSWVRVPDRMLTALEHEEFGYRQFQEIWKQAEKPDGLLVWPDTMVRGSITGMLEAGVSVPRDLKLILHCNEGVPVLCPLPASWLKVNLEQIAAALIGQVERQLVGDPVQPVLVVPTLETVPR
ncbi:MAG: hypothetical protein B9S32_09155 [Verrucomicrobia bacterium Tous-C9LFEB]|nr:MAG: hypothetical protein B9S32_09155 [Verrucomicrobia bacterium Tous-C9LFEB]